MEQNQQKVRKIQQVIQYMQPEGKTAAFAMGMSVLTVFAVLTALCPAWYQSFATYTEFITGVTTFSGYNKEADMRIVKSLLLAIPIFYLLFGALLRFLVQKVKPGQTVVGAFLFGYFLFLVQLMNGESGSGFWGVGLLLLLGSY